MSWDNLVANWPYILAAALVLVLITILLALIFSQKFRKDMVAAPGRMNVYDILSVEGVVVVLLSVILLGSVLYLVKLANESETENLVQKLNETQSELDEIKATMVSRDELHLIMRELEPESPMSLEIRAIAQNREGPWSPFGGSENVLISVPGDLSAGEVRSCPEYHEKTVELLSNFHSDHTELLPPPTITVNVRGVIFGAADCRERVNYDFQLNCDDANTLFSENVLECDQEGNARWFIEDRILPAFAVVMPS